MDSKVKTYRVKKKRIFKYNSYFSQHDLAQIRYFSKFNLRIIKSISNSFAIANIAFYFNEITK